MEGLPSEVALVNSSGAHLVSIKAAAHKTRAAVSSFNSFLELLLRDGNLEPIPKNEAYEVPSVIDPAASSVAPLTSVKDVHLTLGILLGAEPSSVKIVMWVVNHSRPQRLINTILVAI